MECVPQQAGAWPVHVCGAKYAGQGGPASTTGRGLGGARVWSKGVLDKAGQLQQRPWVLALREDVLRLLAHHSRQHAQTNTQTEVRVSRAKYSAHIGRRYSSRVPLRAPAGRSQVIRVGRQASAGIKQAAGGWCVPRRAGGGSWLTFRSLCTTPLLWQYATAPTIWRIMPLTSCSV